MNASTDPEGVCSRHDRCGRLIVPTFFVLLLMLGLFTCGDYGTYVDERINQEFGGGFVRKMLGEGTIPVHARSNGPEAYFLTHGLVFEALLQVLQSLMQRVGWTDPTEVLFVRHLATFLTFFVATAVFFLLCRRGFGSWKWGLVGSLLLVLSPAVYGNAFVNSVDIPFLCFFMTGTWTFLRFRDNPCPRTSLLHAAATALALGVRLSAGVLVLTTVVFSLADARRADPTRRRQMVASLALYLVVSAVLLVASWPALWADLPHLLLVAIATSTGSLQDHWVGGTPDPTYGPLSILITTPPLYILLFALGVIVAARRLILPGPHPLPARQDIHVCIFLLLFPMISSAVLGTRQYGGPRHFLFVYPFFLFLALLGLASTCSALKAFPRRLRLPGLAALLGCASASFVDTGVALWRAHPVEVAYRNGMQNLVRADGRLSDPAAALFLAERLALESIAAQDPDPDVPVFPMICGLGEVQPLDTLVLAPAERARVRAARSLQEARYLICSGRGCVVEGRLEVSKPRRVRGWRRRGDVGLEMFEHSSTLVVELGELIYLLSIQGADIIAVYRLR